MTTTITEVGTAAPIRTGPGRVKLRIIDEGVGSSGVYTAETLAQAAKDHALPRGTQVHLNHDSASDRMDRPEGDLRNLVGVLTEDAYVEGDALVAEARIGSAWRDWIDDFGEFVGVSISAAAEVAQESGQTIVKKILPHPFNRADLVTVPGRGGRIADVLEAATRITDSLPDTAGSTNKKEGHPMATIEESRLTALESDSRRVTALEAEKSEAVTRAEEAEAALAAANQKITELTEAAEAKETAAREARVTAAEAVIKEAYGEDAPAFIVEAAKAAAAADTFNEAEAREAAQALHAAEAGKPQGVGQVREDGAPKTHSDADIVAALDGQEA